MDQSKKTPITVILEGATAKASEVLSSAAARMRRTRARRRAGLMWLAIEADEAVVDQLVVGGWLRPELADEPAAIRRALERMLREMKPVEF